MKTLAKLLLITLTFISSAVFAHGGDSHGKANPAKALEIAQSTAKKLTFKANGMSIGKIDKSWNNIAKEDFIMVEMNDEAYLVKAKNKANDQELFFIVGKDGKVKDVKDGKSFSKGHGHSH